MTDTKISSNKQKKGAIVSEITAKVQKSKGLVFADYQGLTHHQLEELKRAMKKIEAEFIATKNTLLQRALKEGGVKAFDTSDTSDTFFSGPTATLFIYNDLIDPLKELRKTIKILKLPVIKFGIIEGKRVDASQIERLSTLPPLNILRAQLLGQLQSPISGLHRALNWNLQKLVLTLNAVKEKKV